MVILYQYTTHFPQMRRKMFSETLLYSSIQRHNNNSLYSYVAANHEPNTAQCFHRLPPWVEKL